MFLLLGVAVIFFFLGYKMDNIINKNDDAKNVSQGTFQSETFYAVIEKIDDRSLIVEGIAINDINFRGKFQLNISDDTKLEWRYTDIKLSDLNIGDNISITFSGEIVEISPAIIQDVEKIQLLDDKK